MLAQFDLGRHGRVLVLSGYCGVQRVVLLGQPSLASCDPVSGAVTPHPGPPAAEALRARVHEVPGTIGHVPRDVNNPGSVGCRQGIRVYEEPGAPPDIDLA
jgi:hypothetical protein